MNSILQLVDSLRPDELIWLHAYMTGRVHALMPATHLQMSGRPMGAQSRDALPHEDKPQVSPVNRVRLQEVSGWCT